ncbi:hypothetical protein lerEdw1_007584 [Lerista edwardsae]|nr:hypothetical protein lerEdw1_007584 [Lerista edwardsae]
MLRPALIFARNLHLQSQRSHRPCKAPGHGAKEHPTLDHARVTQSNALFISLPSTKMDPSFICMFPLQFEAGGTLLFIGLESDNFQNTGNCEEAQILRNIEDRVLVALPTDQTDAATFESITIHAMEKVSGIRFNIHTYKDTNPRGFPVAFSTQWNNTTYYMHVERQGDNMRVAFKKGNLPNDIRGTTSDILFFKIPFSKGSRRYFMFESTLEPDYFLAFEKDTVTNIRRLIVKKTKAREKVDEFTKIYYAAS